jgi:death-on-curing protein
MSEPAWVSRRALELLHQESLAEHGGAEGLRDAVLLDSALARAQNIHAYQNVDDPFRLAAAYAFGIAMNHPFVDGNRRAAFIAAGFFLRINAIRLKADKAQAVLMMFDLAAGQLPEPQFAEWLWKNA